MSVRSFLIHVGLVALLATGCSGDNNANDSGPPTDGTPPTDGAPSGTSISQAELQRITATLADDAMEGRDEGTPGGAAARSYIIDELKKCNIAPAGENGGYEQKITTGKGTNVIGKIEGNGSSAQKARHVVISAHYDHLGMSGGMINNGADDNASGVAVVLRVACALAKKPTARSVVVALWDAEEPPDGWLTDAMGSAFWIAHATVPIASVDLALVLDAVGGDVWAGQQTHFLLGTELSPEIRAAVIKTAKPSGLDANRLSLHLVEELPTGTRQPYSDYHNFRESKIPFIFSTSGINKYYHTPGDILSTLDLPKMKRVADYLLAVVQQLGNREGDGAPSYNATATDHHNDVPIIIKTLEAAIDPQGLAKTIGSTSRANLKKDLDKIKAIKTKLDGGSQLDATDVRTMRSAVQRVLCLASGFFGPEAVCNIF